MGALFEKIQPTVVFHVASPVSSGNDANEQVFHKANVEGTIRLLDCSKNAKSVKTFVYTSSSSVVEGPYVPVDETRSFITRSSSRANHYSISKARAEELVSKANNPAGLRTVSLRVAGIYGDRDNQMISGTLKVLKDKR